MIQSSRKEYALPVDSTSPDRGSDLLRPQLARFFDAATDAIVFLDRKYNFTFLNRRALEVLAPDGSLLGKNLFESFPGVIYDNSPYVESYRRSMEDGESGEFEAYYPEPLNLWLRVQSYPIDEGIMIYFRDFTQEKLDREELRRKSEEAERQHAEIDTVYRTAPIGLALFDTKDYRYLRLNDRQAAFFGLKPEQIVGKTLMEMAPIEGLKELFDQVLQGTPVVNYPLEGKLATDPTEHRYWTVSYFPVYGPDGTVQAITAASLEITQQKKAEQALIENGKLAAVGRLASSIAHEINNPLESVTNLLYLSKHSEDINEVRGYLEMADRELRRMAAITSQTLRFHRQSSSPRAVRIQDLVETALSIYQGKIVNTNVQVIERHRSVKPVRCFEGEIRQVISNLISNALDAMSEKGGRLEIRTREATNWSTGEAGVVTTFADTGSGMKAETLAKLFRPFFTTKDQTGTGLGLWVSQEIVLRHRGEMRVRSSQAAGHQGTVFGLFLPFDAVVR